MAPLQLQEEIEALDPNWAEKGQENTRRGNANDQELHDRLTVVEDLPAPVRTINGVEPDGAGNIDTSDAFIAPPMTTAERDAIADPQLGQVVENITTGMLEHYTARGWEPASRAVVVVSTSVTLAAITVTGDLTYTIPLGAAFREAQVTVPNRGQDGRGGILTVTADPTATVGAIASGISNTSTVAFVAKAVDASLGMFLRGQGSASTEIVTSAHLSGTSLVLQVSRVYSTQAVRGAEAVQIVVHGRP